MNVAIDKRTGLVVPPQLATKLNKYCCPNCNNDVTFKNGLINASHFAHKKNNACGYYDKIEDRYYFGESTNHKLAKIFIKSIIDARMPFTINKKCFTCKEEKEIINFNKFDNADCKIEYGFQFNSRKYIADVGILNNNELVFIIEICHTHKTNEIDRPTGMWAEIYSVDITSSMLLLPKIKLNCVRPYECVKCEINRVKQIKEYNEFLRIKQIQDEQRNRLIQEKQRLLEVQSKFKLEQEEKMIKDQEESQRKQREMDREEESQRKQREMDRFKKQNQANQLKYQKEIHNKMFGLIQDYKIIYTKMLNEFWYLMGHNVDSMPLPHHIMYCEAVKTKYNNAKRMKKYYPMRRQVGNRKGDYIYF
jgi:hypothetical protein